MQRPVLEPRTQVPDERNACEKCVRQKGAEKSTRDSVAASKNRLEEQQPGRHGWQAWISNMCKFGTGSCQPWRERNVKEAENRVQYFTVDKANLFLLARYEFWENKKHEYRRTILAHFYVTFRLIRSLPRRPSVTHDIYQKWNFYSKENWNFIFFYNWILQSTFLIIRYRPTNN